MTSTRPPSTHMPIILGIRSSGVAILRDAVASGIGRRTSKEEASARAQSTEHTACAASATRLNRRKNHHRASRSSVSCFLVGDEVAHAGLWGCRLWHALHLNPHPRDAPLIDHARLDLPLGRG